MRGDVLVTEVTWRLDYVVGPEQSSTDVLYETIGQDIIKSVMDGYNGLIFAYGQTASGVS